MYSKMGNFINGSWNNNSKEKIDVSIRLTKKFWVKFQFQQKQT